MFKNKFVLEVKGAGEKIYSFQCDPSAPLGEIHDALISMKTIIVNQINEYNSKEKKINPEEEKDEYK